MYISLNNLFMGIIFVLLICILVLGIIFLLKLNKTISNVLEILENNKKNIEYTCDKLPVVSKNMVEITDNIKDISEVATDFTADAIVTKENIINNYDMVKEIFKIMLTQIIKNKIGKEKTDEFLKKLNIGGDKDMMAVCETIQQDNKRIYRRGKKDGINEGITKGIMQNSIEIAKKLLKENFSKEKVSSITGLSEEEIEKIR